MAVTRRANQENRAVLGMAEIKAGQPQCVRSQMLCIVVLSANTASQGAGNQRLARLLSLLLFAFAFVILDIKRSVSQGFGQLTSNKP